MPKHFTPEDDENTMYLLSCVGYTLDNIIDIARDKWGNDMDFSKLNISSEKIHTRCITYDLHDPADWDDYIILEYS